MTPLPARPGLAFTLDGKINSVLSLNLDDQGRIRTIFPPLFQGEAWLPLCRLQIRGAGREVRLDEIAG